MRPNIIKSKFASTMSAIALSAIICSLPSFTSASEDNKSNSHVEAKTVPEANKLIALQANEVIEILGSSFKAKTNSQFVKNTSSEFITLAVTSGTLIHEKTKARAGEAFIVQISGQRVQKFHYDAARFLATAEPELTAQIGPSLNAIAKSQKRMNFWGLLEPTGVNTSSPLPPFIERVRATYLTAPVIIELRHKSRGDVNALQLMTAQKFKDAIGDSDVETIAALIDPLPFSDSTDNAKVWLEARRNFAIQITHDSAMKAAFANGGLNQDPLIGTFFVGPEGATYRIITVNRDSAVFIGAVEAIKTNKLER